MNWRDYYNTTTPGNSNGYISMFDGYARNYMDPNSKYNTGLRHQFNSQGQDMASSQHAQGMKMQAAGVNPFANQQYRQASGQAREASMSAYNEAVRGNQQLGAGMLGMGLQARTQMSQQEQQHDAMAKERAQHERGQWLTLGGTLLGATVMGPVASMFTKPTSIVNNMPEGMGPLATSMYQTSPEAASVQDWVVKNNVNTDALGDITSPEYANARRMFGDGGISAWQDNALSRGVINPSTRTPGWLNKSLLSQATTPQTEAATPAVPTATEQAAYSPEQETKFRAYMREAWGPQAEGKSIERLMRVYNSWRGNNFSWDTWR